jgi:O-antigen/teichoic acid export membrane protein
MLSLGTALSQGLTAVLFILTARSSPVEIFGLVAASIAAGMVAAGLVDFGFNSLFTRELASRKLGLAEFWARANAKVLVGAGLSAIWFAYGFLWDSNQISSSLVFLSVLVFQTSLVPLRAASESATITLLFILERLLATCVFFTLVVLELSSSQALVISLLTGTGVASVISLLISRKKGMMKASVRLTIWPWRGTHGYGLFASANALQQLDLPLLTIFAGPAASGIYASVSKWTQPLGIVANAFSTAATPFIAKASSLRSAIQETKKAAWLILLACASASLIVPLAPIIVDILLGSAYLDSIQVLQILAIGTIPAILNQVFASGLQARGFERQVAITNIVCVTLQLALIICASGFGGAIAAAIAFAAIQLGMFLTLAIILGRKLRLEPRSI